MIINWLILWWPFLSFIMCDNLFFKDLPPRIIYYSCKGRGLPLILTCKAWNPKTIVRIYSTSMNTNGLNSTRSFVIKPPKIVDSEYNNDDGASIVVRSVSHARILNKLNFHCLARTQTGLVVVSRPFRIMEAYIGAFFSSSEANGAKKALVTFLYGNVAYIDCIAPISFPPAVIKVKFNGTDIDESGRHRYVQHPYNQKVTLLISSFETRDQGDYRCFATNNITGEQRLDPSVQQLKMMSSSMDLSASIRKTILGKDLARGVTWLGSIEVLTLREGSDVAFFCVIEGEPPPQVTTSKLTINLNKRDRHLSDNRFGLLSIRDLALVDEGLYSCSGAGVNDVVRLKVQRRLRIDRGPRDVVVDELGSQAVFSCLSSEDHVIPQWIFMGTIKLPSVRIFRGSSLIIPSVKEGDLGLYQCVIRSGDEWVTQLARLGLKADKQSPSRPRRSRREVFLTSDTRRSNINKNTSTEDLQPPEVHTLDDNLAVLLRWVRISDAPRLYRVQYMSRKEDTSDWSPMNSFDDEITVGYLYVTRRHLRAQYLYKFRVSTLLPGRVSRHSPWSRPISFAHIYPTQPTVQLAQPHNDSHARVKWHYLAGFHFPVNNYKVLVRKTTREGAGLQYSKYSLYQTRSQEATDTFVGPLEAGSRYQVVVYGVKDSEPRRITLYSAEVVFETLPLDQTPASNSESNTRLMFVILGSLAGLMVLVIVVLVLMCYCREHKSLARPDPDKHSFKRTKAVQSSLLLSSISAVASANKQQVWQGGEQHSGLLLGGPDDGYHQQKREPPSGGSWHDLSDSERDRHLAREHPGSTVVTPLLPSVAYYKTRPGPASLPAGSLVRRPVPQFAPLATLANSGLCHSSASPLRAVFSPQQYDLFDSRSQDGRASYYSPFSHASPHDERMYRTAEMGSQTVNSNDVGGGHRHRRKRRKTSNSASCVSGAAEVGGTLPREGPRASVRAQRDAMHDSTVRDTPSVMVAAQFGVDGAEYCGTMNGTLSRKGTPTLFVEPPRIRDFSEYGIQQQPAHLSQQNLHLHNQHFGGYREAQA